MFMSANDSQVAGTHYKAGIQHWDYVLMALQGRYLEGNITKYVTRHRKKNGVQDLEKALHYMAKLIEEVSNGRLGSPPPHRGLVDNVNEYIHKFCVENGLNTLETYVCLRLAEWNNVDQLRLISNWINQLLTDAKQDDSRAQARKAGALPDVCGEQAGAGYVNQG
jgi:hypothetical protein